MKCDQDLCLNLWYDLNKLLWQDELNPRVRCAFGNVFIFGLAPLCRMWASTTMVIRLSLSALYLWSSLFPPPFLSDLVAESSHNFLDIGKCHHFCQAPPPRELNPRKFPASLKDKRDTYTIIGAHGKRGSNKNTACQNMRLSKHNVKEIPPPPTLTLSSTSFWIENAPPLP